MSIFRIITCILLLTCVLVNYSIVSDAARQKSSVLLVFNDQSGRDNGERLAEIAHGELDKKINGIYNVIDSKSYEKFFLKQSYFDSNMSDIEPLVSSSTADYFVYVELMPFRQAEGFNIIWHRKKMVATMGLIIIDLKQHKELFKETYSVEKNDDTDFFFVGSPSMARKSLRGVLFVVGEAISVHLPM